MERNHKTDQPLVGCRYLVVDDLADQRFLVRRFIESVGGQVDELACGEEVIATIASAEETYDAILLDMRMPGIGGHETTSILRNMKVQTPIIALTASAMNGDGDQCLAAGCDAYFFKPIDRPKLIAFLESLNHRPDIA